MHKIQYLSIFVALTALTTTTALGQGAPTGGQSAGIGGAAGGIHSVIQNTRTARHINIPGTRVFIIAPAGFQVAENFTGLEKGSLVGLNVFDLPGGSFYTNAATFSREAFEAKGAKVYDYRQLRVCGYPAKFVHMQGDPGAKEYALVFGDSTFSTMIMAAYPYGHEAEGDELVAALNTLVYDKNLKVDPLATAFFSLDDHASRFKYVRTAAGVYCYTLDGRDNTNDPDVPMMLISQLPGDGGTMAKEEANLVISKLGQQGFGEVRREGESTGEVNGCEAYRVKVYGKSKGVDLMIYVCAMKKNDKIILMEGIVRKDPEQFLVELDKCMHSLHVK